MRFTSRRFLRQLLLTGVLVFVCAAIYSQPALRLNDQEYFHRRGVDVMVFQDIYPEGHQGGVSIIQNGVRVASNGDLRLEPTPGQWQPIPVQHERLVDKAGNRITVSLSFPDSSRHLKGFNPINYPDLYLSYKVRVEGEGAGFRIVVDLDKPLPQEWVGKVGFNMELFPTDLFGRTWYLGSASGLFPRQANGPVVRDASGEVQAIPFASGPRLVVAPDVDAQRLVIESRTGDIELLDGRIKHNNGWFVVRSVVPAGKTKGAIEWYVEPNALPDYRYEPVVHVSQVGYHTRQSKVATIELDANDRPSGAASLLRIDENGGPKKVLSAEPAPFGPFLRYNYIRFDFSSVTTPGMYVVEYAGRRSNPFEISNDVFERHVWQPTLEYFLPVQMCHMRVEEQYRVWHGLCHMDDARMAPVDTNHFDGYLQGSSTLTGWKSGEVVPGLNTGGWHDAGDDDLRIESQADETYILAAAFEQFGEHHDNTSIDQQALLVKIHQPDGKPDLLQQVEHGVRTILGGYRGLGRLYRGIIVPTLPQYVHLGDWMAVTDNLFYSPDLKPGEKTGTHSSLKDDRLVFTEQNPSREFKGIAALAIAGRILKTEYPEIATESIAAAEALWLVDRSVERGFADQVTAAAELFLTTGRAQYRDFLMANRDRIVKDVAQTGWIMGRVLPLLNDAAYTAAIREGVRREFKRTVDEQKKNPFGVPYRPVIWGAGWGIQEFGVQQYYLHTGFPDVVSTEYMLNALNFVLGNHPGINTASFASGVGSRSMTTAYGINRADWSYIPGGVVSGTALIRPDFPEMKDFPYLWQQGEYVLGGGASNFMFLVLAANHVLNP